MKNLLQLALALLLVSSLVMLSPQNSYSTTYTFNVIMEGSQEVPPNTTTATGSVIGTYDDATNIIDFTCNFSGLQSNTNNAHFHGAAFAGSNAPVIISWTANGFPLGVTSGTYSRTFVLTGAQETMLLNGEVYANIHTTGRPGGELRGQMDEGGTLPVELSSFTSVINKNNVTLNWSTAVEVNNAGFDIERKSATADWTKISHIEGHGNSVQPQNYSVTDGGLAIGSYNYRLKQIDLNGNFEYFELTNEVVVGQPLQYDLSQNYPNPFNPSTNINFEIPDNGFVNIKLYDVTGREVKTLLNDFKSAGYYSIQLNAADLSSGIYFYTLTSGNFVSTKKLNLIK